MDGVAIGIGEGTEAALLAHLRAGRSSAYALLKRRNNQRLYRLARGILGDDAEAEEAVQEGYVRAFTHLEGFKGEAGLATWLGQIVLNEALGRLRRRRPAVDIDEMAETRTIAAGAAESQEQAIARQEIRRAIEAAVDQLPVAFRSVFILRAIEQMSLAATVACLGICGNTVKTRLHRANRLLRQTLSQHFGALLDGTCPFLGARCDHLVVTVLKRLGLPADRSSTAPPQRSTGAVAQSALADRSITPGRDP